eukprot:gnl/MRDRNA2_/MRDRNA2_244579_c0_seq1.p1 gnl/MRDRNA2_/MRDRNA2_244579_c0~~gnl/MRDRNA2_/MRDRNA2_244579_c0_seq1.p1  ORF type:complete len:233 (-),score=31.66 gnl/MRDRNA2_/MRDRNA2_244579_c0_seq1:231-929(-)
MVARLVTCVILWLTACGTPCLSSVGSESFWPAFWEQFWTDISQNAAQSNGALDWVEQHPTTSGLAELIVSRFPNRSLYVLQIGCGYSQLAELLHNFFERVHNIDVAPTAIQLMQIRYPRDVWTNLTFECVDVFTATPTEKFDLVIDNGGAFDILFDKNGLLKAIDRHLLVGGHYVVTTEKSYSEMDAICNATVLFRIEAQFTLENLLIFDLVHASAEQTDVILPSPMVSDEL